MNIVDSGSKLEKKEFGFNILMLGEALKLKTNFEVHLFTEYLHDKPSKNFLLKSIKTKKAH